MSISSKRKSLAPMAMDRRQSVAVSDHSGGETSSMSNLAMRRMSRQEFNPAQLGTRRMTMYRRGSSTSISDTSGKLVRLENTYALGPKPNEKFDVCKVQKSAASILSSFLAGETYDRQNCARLSQNIADMIKNRVKEEHLFPRYKIVCHVLIAKNAGQSLHSASRCIWGTETDSHAVATYTSKDLVATAVVFGLYYE